MIAGLVRLVFVLVTGMIYLSILFFLPPKPTWLTVIAGTLFCDFSFSTFIGEFVLTPAARRFYDPNDYL